LEGQAFEKTVPRRKAGDSALLPISRAVSFSFAQPLPSLCYNNNFKTLMLLQQKVL
jgi:hypothetical protein